MYWESDMNLTGIVPHLVVDDGHKAVEFYKTALGAELCGNVMPAEDGKRVMHAMFSVGGAMFMMNDDFPEYCDGQSRSPKKLGGTGVTLHLNVPNCDAAMAKMAAAGGTITMPAMDAFWGDRYGRMIDPFGHEWSFAHHLSAEEAQAAAAKWKETGGCM
jgi:PhnB protein